MVEITYIMLCKFYSSDTINIRLEVIQIRHSVVVVKIMFSYNEVLLQFDVSFVPGCLFFLVLAINNMREINSSTVKMSITSNLMSKYAENMR